MNARPLPTVSVVIPTYNRAHILGDAIASVLAQTYTAFELIVVDDGSRDESAADVVRRFGDPRVRLVRQQNRGLPGARNTGAALAGGEILAFLDDDDCWKPDKLACDVAFLVQHPEAQAVFCDVEKHDGDVFVPSFTRAAPIFGGTLKRRPEAESFVLSRREMFLCLLQEIPILPSAFAVRRAAFQRIGGFDESWRSFEDWEFLIRFSERETIGYVDRPLAVVRISTDSLHRVASVPGRTALIELLRRERARRVGFDPEAVAAIDRGIAHQRKTMGWHYSDAGRRLAAARNYVQGFKEVFQTNMLLRAAIVWLPRWLQKPVRALGRDLFRRAL